MSVFDELKVLEEKKQDLVKKAKADALGRARSAVDELNALGFTYQLVEGSVPTSKAPRRGVRADVLKVVAASATGIPRAEILQALNATDKRSKQSVSNALAALKKAGHIRSDAGRYWPVSK